ncbi:MAG: nicotinate-nucleotide adenylyltransferase [Bacillota bacterium]|nr:nicotinate-nucleotide adenylyltransferase [Bacillota bacterium]
MSHDHNNPGPARPVTTPALPDAPAPKARAIGVLGGTFDPVHLGHLAIARAAAAALALEQVLFVPAHIQPHKLTRRVSAPEHRWAMLELALEGQQGLSASRAELDRGGPSYTSETLRELRTTYGGDVRLFFICGADALQEMDSWHRPDVLLASATVAVARRPGCPASSQIPAIAARLTAAFGGEVVVFDAPLLDISSTAIRSRVAKGVAVEHLIPNAVYQYVLKNRLYTEGNCS